MSQLPEFRHTTIIGLGHKARQGKDTVAGILETLAPGRVRRFGCADALYAYCRVALGMTKKDPELLQFVGVNWRERDLDVWVRAVLWAIHSWDVDAHSPQLAIISDIRFPNEANLVQELGGVLIRIDRWNQRGDGAERVFASDRSLIHSSETALNEYPWPHVLKNVNGELNVLSAEVHELARRLVPAIFAPHLLEPKVWAEHFGHVA